MMNGISIKLFAASVQKVQAYVYICWQKMTEQQRHKHQKGQDNVY